MTTIFDRGPYRLWCACFLALALGWVNAARAHELRVSGARDRSGSIPLAGLEASGGIYTFLVPTADAREVRFYLDDPTLSRAPRRVERNAPYDFAGGSASTALPFDTRRLADGVHRITAQVVLLSGGTAVVDASFTVANRQSSALDQVHLAWGADPTTSIIVVWRTLAPLSISGVRYRTPGSLNWQAAAGGPRPSGTEGTLHQVAITALAPNTPYEYQVQGGDGLWSETFTLRTAPMAGADWDAVFVADTGLIGRLDGLTTGTQQVIDEIAQLKPRMVLLGGDYAYFNTDKRYVTLDATIDAWFNQMQPIARQAPMMPVYGNHEVGLDENLPAWQARFPTPAGFDRRRSYSFDIGDVHFVAIFAISDRNGLRAGTEAWIEQDIQAAYAAGARWVIPYLHVAPFSDGRNHRSNLALRAELGPLFERLHVPLVLTAHDQSYVRTYPLIDVPATNTPTSLSRDCYTADDGVTWVKISPGGKMSSINGAFSRFETPTPPAYTAFRDNTRHHYSRLRVFAAGSLQLDTYGVKGDGSPGAVIDSFRYTTGTCEPPGAGG